MILREETGADAEAIAAVTEAAFRGQPYSRQTEVGMIHALREAGALSLSLVAEEDGQVVGHAAFSPLEVSDGTAGWFGLGPISVLPACQRRGIGRALIAEGLSRLRARGARGCALVGHPGYYTRLGFQHPPALALEGVPPEVFMVLPLDGRIPEGRVKFHPAFGEID